MDPVLSKALHRRSELRRELADVDRFIQLYEMFKRDNHSPQQSLELDDNNVDSKEQTESATLLEAATEEAIDTIAVPKRGLSRDELRPFIDETIRQAGRPLSRGQLLRSLDIRGIHVGGRLIARKTSVPSCGALEIIS